MSGHEQRGASTAGGGEDPASELVDSSGKRLRGGWALIALGAVVGACSGTPSEYPGRADVIDAQAKWCDALAELDGAGASWEHASTCKGFHPSGSAAYVAAMAECFPRRMEAAGQGADTSQIMTDCEAEAMVALPLEDEAGNRAIEARCERATRCEGIAKAECMEALQTMETSQRSVFTMMYNAHALADITDCLASSGCGDDDEAARQECYAPHIDRLLWFPD